MPYPLSVITYSPSAHFTGDTLQPSDYNQHVQEIIAVEKGLLNGFQHNLLAAQATLALGQPGSGWNQLYLRAGTGIAGYTGIGVPSSLSLPTGNYTIGDLYFRTDTNTEYICISAGTQATSLWQTIATISAPTLNPPVTIQGSYPSLLWSGTESGTVQKNIAEVAGDLYILSNAVYSTSASAFQCVNTGLSADGVCLFGPNSGTPGVLRKIYSNATVGNITWTVLFTIDRSGNLTFNNVTNNFSIGSSLTNQIALAGSTAGTPVSLTASGGDSVINFLINPKGAGGRVQSSLNGTNVELTPVFTGSGAPNSGLPSGTYSVGDEYINTTTGPNYYICTTAGTNSSSIWTQINGTGSISGLTNGEVLFGAGGTIGQSPNLFWNNSTNTFSVSGILTTTSIIQFGSLTGIFQDSSANKILSLGGVASAVNYPQLFSAGTGQPVDWRIVGSDTNVNFKLETQGTGYLQFGGGAGVSFLETLRLVPAASAVNYLEIDSAATGNPVPFYARGTDPNIGLNYFVKGNKGHSFYTGGGLQTFVADTTSSVNWVQLTGSGTGNPVQAYAQGSDTNIAFKVLPQGVGGILFGTGGLATNAAGPFPYMPTFAGTPTGTPTAYTGFAPYGLDDTNHIFYFYSLGLAAWQAMVSSTAAQTITNKTIGSGGIFLTQQASAPSTPPAGTMVLYVVPGTLSGQSIRVKGADGSEAILQDNV
jgi:hypothetical protein